MALLHAACPDIRRMIFKFQPEFLSNYLQLAVFDKLQHFETWGGEYMEVPSSPSHTAFLQSGLQQLLEVLGPNLLSLHLCHVEELTIHSILHLATSCPHLTDIKLENCSFVVDNVNPLNEEQLEVINGSVPLLLDLQALRIVNKMPLEMMLMVLRKALNIVTIDMDSMETLTDSTVLQLLQVNRLSRLQTLSVMATK